MALWQWLGRSLAGRFPAPQTWRAAATSTETPGDDRAGAAAVVAGGAAAAAGVFCHYNVKVHSGFMF